MTNKLEIGPHCHLQYYNHCGVALCYAERSPDSWYSDMDTEVDIDQAKAADIIAWLEEKYPALAAGRDAKQRAVSNERL